MKFIKLGSVRMGVDCIPLRFLRYKRSHGPSSDWKTKTVDPPSANSFFIDGLLPDSTYEFSIRAKDSQGKGNFSKVAPCRTMGKSLWWGDLVWVYLDGGLRGKWFGLGELMR